MLHHFVTGSGNKAGGIYIKRCLHIYIFNRILRDFIRRLNGDTIIRFSHLFCRVNHRNPVRVHNKCIIFTNGVSGIKNFNTVFVKLYNRFFRNFYNTFAIFIGIFMVFINLIVQQGLCGVVEHGIYLCRRHFLRGEEVPLFTQRQPTMVHGNLVIDRVQAICSIGKGVCTVLPCLPFQCPPQAKIEGLRRKLSGDFALRVHRVARFHINQAELGCDHNVTVICRIG